MTLEQKHGLVAYVTILFILIFSSIVTVGSAVLISLLIFWEILDWSRPDWKPQVIVDHSRESKMTINFDISFPKVPCFALTLDVMDAADQYQNNLSDGIFKVRLDRSTLKGIDNYVELAMDKRPTCGNCYEAASLDSTGKPACCNSCSSVFAAYEQKGLPAPVLENIQQCLDEKWPEKMKNFAKEGCRVMGKVQVNKVSGNLHFAPGESHESQGMHLHDYRFLDSLHLDFSHHIHYLTFGEYHPHLHYPLDDFENKADSAEKSFKYYAKVVASDLKSLNGKIIRTNQFAVTRNEKETKSDKKTFPSVFFHFEISPMIIIYTKHRRSIFSLLVELCAIIGGVYTVASILDSFIFFAERKLREKNVIGKAH